MKIKLPLATVAACLALLITLTPGSVANSAAAPGAAIRSTALFRQPLPAPTLMPEMEQPHPGSLRRPKTPTPEPTPEEKEPASGWDFSFPRHRGSKLGLHFVRTTAGSFDFVRQARPAVVKAVDDLGFLTEIEDISPESLILARFDGRDEALRDMDPEDAARAYVNFWLPVYRRNPSVDYWEGWNEYQPDTAVGWRWYAEFEAARACLMHRHGLRAAVGGFSTGRPEFREMLLFLPAIRAAATCRGILTLHEYSAPTLQYGFGLPIPGRPAYPDRGILTFRYRYFYEDIFKVLDLPVPLVISEAGIDGGVRAGRPGPDGSGWKDFVSYWKDLGMGEDGAQSYLNQLIWYDQELQKDRYLLGVALYTAGQPEGSWSTFDLEPLYGRLADYVRSQK